MSPNQSLSVRRSRQLVFASNRASILNAVFRDRTFEVAFLPTGYVASA